MKSITLFAFLAVFMVSVSHAQNQLNEKFEKIVFGVYTDNLADFEAFAIRAKQSGATHINITNEDLPLGRWQYDVEDDPYPSWVITNTGLLKIATPEVLRPFIPQDYSESVMKILEDRCKILRKHGLKASFKTFEPQMLPEAVYEKYPLWRGPRVDHPMRSRAARWAPDIDNPEVLELYKESLGILLARCPEIEILSLTTNDSGTGLSWSGGLYDGRSGSTLYRNRRMDERLYSFFGALQEAAAKAGNTMDIDFYWTREQFPARIAENLGPGMAIENLEGPNATPFKAEVGFLMDYYQFHYPVLGIPKPVGFLEELEKAYTSGAKRLFYFMGDRFNTDLYFAMYDKFNLQPTHDLISRLNFLKELAAELEGEDIALPVYNLWFALGEAQKHAHWVETGGFIYYLGGVQQRWITRPFVPFPEELKPEERDYFRRFQFQAKTEEHANDMADLQATRLFAGWSGRFYVHKVMNEVRRPTLTARSEVAKILAADILDSQKRKYDLLDKRLQAFYLLSNNAENATSYQAQIDRVKAIGCEPDPRPDVGTRSSWDRSLILETVRQEIDNTALLIQLLESTDQIILDLAPTKKEEDIRRLGPDVVDQLKIKLRIMNSRWLDYNRLFTTPRP
jgi:hypothetical protein